MSVHLNLTFLKINLVNGYNVWDHMDQMYGNSLLVQ